MLNTIKQITEEEFKLPDISKRTRKHPYPEARAIYYAVAKEIMPNVSLGIISKKMDRDHATAINGIKKLKDTYLRDIEFRILHKKIMDRVAMENNKEPILELDLLRKENIELKRKLEELLPKNQKL